MPLRFYGTKKVTLVGNSTAVFVDAHWEIPTGVMVNLEVSRQDDTNRCLGTKKLCSMGRGSRVVYLDKAWGFTPGDWVVFCLEVRE